MDAIPTGKRDFHVTICQLKAFCESICRGEEAKINVENGAQDRYTTVC